MDVHTPTIDEQADPSTYARAVRAAMMRSEGLLFRR
jgi:hypothetical protein